MSIIMHNNAASILTKCYRSSDSAPVSNVVPDTCSLQLTRECVNATGTRPGTATGDQG